MKHTQTLEGRRLSELLKEQGVLGICDIRYKIFNKNDTKWRRYDDDGFTYISDVEELKNILSNSPRIEDINYINQVSTKEPYIHKHGALTISIMDYNKAMMSDKK